MADAFTNDLRIREQEVGSNSGAWGGYLNVSLSNLAESWSYGTEALADSAAQTLTLADGASDELRSFYVKLTGTLSQATTVTLAPNTISKVWMIENATTGGYDVTISQGSGANVTVGNGNVKMIATDGAGSGGVVYDLLTDLELAGNVSITTADNTTQLTLTSTDDDASTGPKLDLFRDSGSPADDDILGKIRFLGDNDSGGQLTYADIESRIVDASNGSEDGRLELSTALAGSGSVSRIFMDATETIINNDSKDLDFRVEGNGDANLFFVDASTDRIGIGTSSPATLLDVKGSTGNSVITLNSATAIDSYPSIGKLRFFSNDNSTNSSGEVGSIEVIGIGTWNGAANSAAMTFNLIQGLAGTTSPVEAMRIGQDGKLGINTTALNEDVTFASVTGGEERVLEFKCDNSNDYWSILPYDRTNSHGVKLYLGTGGQLKVLNNNAVTIGDSLLYAHPSNGKIGVGTTSPGGKFMIEADGSAMDILVINNTRSGSNSTAIQQFKREGTNTGFIANTSSATSYATSQSDRRAKKNFEDWTESVLPYFKDLKPTKFHFTQEDDSSEKNKGYIAQDLVGSFPEAYPLKDSGEDADRYFFNPSGMVVYLMKAIQEQQELIETLQTKVKALEET